MDKNGSVDLRKIYRDAHSYADTDYDPNSIHHTIGRGPRQAAAGNHRHEDLESDVIAQFATNTAEHAALEARIDLIEELRNSFIKLKATANQNFTTAIITDLAVTTVDINRGGPRLTHIGGGVLQVEEDGDYYFEAYHRWANTATIINRRLLQIIKVAGTVELVGTEYMSPANNASAGTIQHHCGITVSALAGDQFKARGYQTTGGTIGTFNPFSWFSGQAVA